MNKNSDSLIEYIRGSIIGDDQALLGPYGKRRVVYADYTASGRSLQFIEDFICGEVMPFYANTHSETSGTGRQISKYREDARQLIKNSVGATDEDVVIFSGSGATGAINKLIDILGIQIPKELDLKFGLSENIPEADRPIVFVGPYEHHSNEIPWRETIADVIEIPEDKNGLVDLAALESALVQHADSSLKIGSFSAASNVTGIRTDTEAVAELLHAHNALSFWDYAAAAPYVDIKMNSSPNYKDAIFISPHKFIGGPGTPGVLVMKKNLLTNSVPSTPGGGTVAYVNPDSHRYLDDFEHREEGGTPAIIEAVRAGMVFQLKDAVSSDVIHEREEKFTQRAIEKWSKSPNIKILGDTEAPRLSIISFILEHNGRYLHHEYVVALLNDLFGIQARGGCSCAGPYGHRLLGINTETSQKFDAEILGGCEILKPGWVRVNFNYFISKAVFEYILDAVAWLAENGGFFLPHYNYDIATSSWAHQDSKTVSVNSLNNLNYQNGDLSYTSARESLPESELRAAFDYAIELKNKIVNANDPAPKDGVNLQTDSQENLRWFALAGDQKVDQNSDLQIIFG